MKSLLILRHGKSDWASLSGNDHDRPLAKRGIRAAGLIGRYLTKIECVPDSVVTSSATRAAKTAELAAEAGKWRCPVRTTSSFYGSSPSDVLPEIQSEPDSTEILLVVGHEPTWSELASNLIGGGYLRMPTAAIARIEFDTPHWPGVVFGQGRLLWHLIPKDLEKAGLG